MYDIRTMTWDETVEAAKAESGLTNDAIAREMSRRTGQRITHGNVARWFHPDDAYWPSAQYLPVLCGVLGNTLMIDWLALQVRPAALESAATMADLTRLLPRMAGELGDLGRELDTALADGQVDASEAKKLRGELLDMQRLVAEWLGKLEKLAMGKGVAR